MRGRIYKYVIDSSDDGKNWTRAVDGSTNEREGESADKCAAKGRYFRLTVLGVELPRGGYAWASINEWRLLAGGLNVALDRPATADSQQNGTYAAKANDGDFNTTWFTGKPTLGNWWKVDLGKPRDLTGCRLMWHDPGFCYQYKIEVSAGNANWTTVVDKTRNTETKWVPVHAFNAKGTRYLRVTATGLDDGCWLGIREVEVFDTLPLPADVEAAKQDVGWDKRVLRASAHLGKAMNVRSTQYTVHCETTGTANRASHNEYCVL